MEKINQIIGSSEGWQGTDACLETSLFEYGLIWKEDKDSGTVRFIYTAPQWGGNERRVLTDWAEERADTDVEKEWDWAFTADNAARFLDSTGITLEEFRRIPFPYQVAELVRYWGTVEIFGESYYPTLTEFDD